MNTGNQNMNALELLPFLGHSSIYPPFDDYLTNMGVTKRPTLKRNLQTSIEVIGAGLYLQFTFDINAKEEGFIAKSEGAFILKHITLMIIVDDKKVGKYTASLPRGLLASDTRASVEQKLGAPKRRNKSSDNYYLDDIVWTVVFDDEKLAYIRLELPDNGWREHGICP